MSDSIQNNVTFQLIATLSAAGTSVAISDDTVNGGACSFADASILVSNSDGTLIERMKGSASAGVLTLSRRGITLDQTLTEDAALKREWRAGAFGFVTVFAFDIIDRENSQVAVFLNAAARDAAITAPAAGMQCYLTTEGYFTDYQGGSWQQRANGATPNASTSVAGKVEIATSAEAIAGTDTGGTGAGLVASPSAIRNNTINQAHTYAADTGAANAYVMAMAGLGSYAIGQRFAFKAANSNTAASTLNINSLGVKTIKQNGGLGDLLPSDILAGQIVEVMYDGTNFQMTSPNANPSGENYFGDGSDGDVTISSGTTTLSTDMFYNNLTMSGTAILNPNGYKVFVKGKLTTAVGNKIQRNGNNGTAGTFGGAG
jgi:hypothetical protein